MIYRNGAGQFLLQPGSMKPVRKETHSFIEILLARFVFFEEFS